MTETALASGVGGVDGLARLPSECEGLQAQRQMIRFMLAGQVAIPEDDHAGASRDCFGVIRDWLQSTTASGRKTGVIQYMNWMRAQATVADIMVRAAEVELGTEDTRRRSNNASRMQARGDITLSVLINLLDQVRAERAKQVGQSDGGAPAPGPAPPLPAPPSDQPQPTTTPPPPTTDAHSTPPPTAPAAPTPDRPPEGEERTRAG